MANPTIDATDLVKVTNVGSVPWETRWASKPYKAAPGKSTFVPMCVVINVLGDPRSAEQAQLIKVNGNPEFIPSRGSEIARLCQYYGAYDNVDKLDQRSPNLEVYSQSDDRIVTVLDEPNGTPHYTGEESYDETKQLHATIDKLTSRLEALENDRTTTSLDHSMDTDDDDDDSTTGTRADTPESSSQFSTAFHAKTGEKIRMPNLEEGVANEDDLK